jgi:Uri superfamily endonuclease
MSQAIDIIKQIPIESGAYGFAVRLSQALDLEIGKFDRVSLPKGLYFYGGSAFGPGGLKARLGRHIRPKSKLHWHIDHVTSAGKMVAAGVIKNGSECKFVARALAMPGALIPLPGFGSSDCRNCASHLVKLRRTSDISKIFAAAGAMQSWRFS